ncbi:MAG: M15 family metallopeptidase [Sphingomonas sp.]|uniref:M15 family metallopeptidase n=1 Tax=Sphingomonas sp. TaxID=28214 RepID=UPI001AC7858B|nr:M15 family metallopeptidase [Sphingomonas sp.]MBN8806962.1 M15 family metallopeptidase [Sphingomonas sp.]
MKRSTQGVAAGIALALAAAATATTLQVDKRLYQSAPAYADKYIALRTPAYTAALTPAADGRVLSHLPYPTTVAAAIDALVGIEPLYRTKQCDMLPVAATAAEKMMRAANADLAGTAMLKAQSCFRSIPEQVGIFCNTARNLPTAKCLDPVKRAQVSAPPGYSEHATGYTADFVACGVGAGARCGGLTQGFAASKPGQWMLLHAREYGFELSFPCDHQDDGRCVSKQGVSYEPWHWRWVGCSAVAPGAAQARQIFADARRRFPANPGIDDAAVPAAGAATAPTCAKD